MLDVKMVVFLFMEIKHLVISKRNNFIGLTKQKKCAILFFLYIQTKKEQHRTNGTMM